MPTLEERLRAARASDVQGLQQRLSSAQASDDGSGAEDAFGLELSRNFINQALGFPSALGKGAVAASAGVATGMDRLVGGDTTFQEMFETGKRESVLGRIPAPKIEDISAGVRSLPAILPGGQSIGERFREERGAIQSDIEARQEAHPIASFMGEVGGDVATLATGRLPFARGINKFESQLLPRAEMFFGRAVPRLREPGIRRTVNDILNSATLRRVARGGGRSLETGFEATVLDLLHDDDPFETAGYAAGGQLGGSAFLSGTKKIFSGGALKAGAKLGLTAASIGASWQVLKSATPGGKDFVLESLETGFDKVTLGIALGVVSGIVGAGRLRGGKRAEDMPKIMDALVATPPRAAALSLLEDLVDADPQTQATTETVLLKLNEDPEFFGPDATNRMQSAMEQERFIEELGVLQGEKDFQQKLFSIQPPALSAGGF